jgi:membrane carboxypeptidase/penicillin-binding protein
MVTAMISPALAVTSVGANSAIGVFDALPEFIELGEQAQKNTLWATVSSDPSEGYVPFAEVYWQDREEIRLSEMSPHLAHAAVAGEDRRFYDHTGVDVNSGRSRSTGQRVLRWNRERCLDSVDAAGEKHLHSAVAVSPHRRGTPRGVCDRH